MRQVHSTEARGMCLKRVRKTQACQPGLLPNPGVRWVCSMQGRQSPNWQARTARPGPGNPPEKGRVDSRQKTAWCTAEERKKNLQSWSR